MRATRTDQHLHIDYLLGIGGLIIVWFASVYVIGTEQLLRNTQEALLPPIAITAIVPIAAFVAAYRASPSIRTRVLSLDIRMLTMLQLWRVVGFSFLLLHAFDVLPGLFAWPAGVGDVLVGVLAAIVVARATRDPAWLTSRQMIQFHLIGLADFVIAVTTAALSTGAIPAFTFGGVTSAAMDVWPLNLFPSFIVPAFVILHLIVLLKIREIRRTARTPSIRSTTNF